MKKKVVFVFLVLLLKHKVTYASSKCTERYSEPDVYLQGFILESLIVDTLFECHRKCKKNFDCASINMNLMDKTCELKYSTKTRHPGKTVQRQNTVYMEIRDHFTPGSDPDNPIVSCKHLKQHHYHAKSGVYWMKFNEPSSAPFQVFCDMTTDGGGWTLVYSYTFTQYSSFKLPSNAVTPIPNWPVDKWSGKWVPQSTTTPLSETSHSAMDFALWKKLGNEFLLKPNITNWVACVEGTGSLVNWLPGSLTCRVVKAITQTCTTVAPKKLEINSCGPLISYTKHYIYLEGQVDGYHPVHDPCGRRSFVNHLTNVSNPGGAVYIR